MKIRILFAEQIVSCYMHSSAAINIRKTDLVDLQGCVAYFVLNLKMDFTYRKGQNVVVKKTAFICSIR